MGLGIPPLKIKILLESNSLKSRILVWRLAIQGIGTAGVSKFPDKRKSHGALRVGFERAKANSKLLLPFSNTVCRDWSPLYSGC